MDLLLILGFSLTIILLVIIFLLFKFSQNNSEKSFINLLDSIKQDQIFNNDLIKNDVSEIIKNKLDQEQNIFDLKLSNTSKNIDKNIQEMKDLVNKKTDDKKINITQLKTVTELLGKQHKNTEDALHESKKELGKLTGVLSSNQIRGQLGEYLAEDILKQGGFIKNVNYKKSEKIVSSGEIPDFTFIIDISIEESQKRLTSSNLDRMESIGKTFFENVRNGYLELAKKTPHRIHLLDGTQSIEYIHTQIISTIQ